MLLQVIRNPSQFGDLLLNGAQQFWKNIFKLKSSQDCSSCIVCPCNKNLEEDPQYRYKIFKASARINTTICQLVERFGKRMLIIGVRETV